jgi:gamma-glutamylcyclotransferase (GGCT)/AIG2-like uncharacterized protein YtfP
MTRHHLYAYGTLQVGAIFAQIVGRAIEGQPATLTGYACYRISDRVYPAIVEAPGSEVQGVVYLGLTAEELERLDVYEGHLYERREVRVRQEDGSLLVETYVLCPEHRHRLSSEAWDRERFERLHLASYLAAVSQTSRAP